MPYTYFWSTGEKQIQSLIWHPVIIGSMSMIKMDVRHGLILRVPLLIGNADLKQDESVVIYPNPVKNRLQIEIPKHPNPQIAWRLVDIHSNLISKGNQLHVETEELVSGVYILEINFKNRLYKRYL